MRVPIPKEHGAWAMLITSLALGQAAAATVNLASIYLWLLAVAVFIVREPLSLLWRHRRRAGFSRRSLKLWAGGWLAAIALLAGLLLTARGTAFMLFAMPAAILFGLQLAWQHTLARWSLPAELAGTAGVTLSAPAAYYVATGRLGVTGASLWPVLLAYFAAQVLYVRWQLRAPASKTSGRATLWTQTLILAASLALGRAGLMPPYLFLAFIPGLVKVLLAMAAAGSRKRPVARVGWTEVIYSGLFFFLAVAAFHAR